jgi:hypothetical protein
MAFKSIDGLFILKEMCTENLKDLKLLREKEEKFDFGKRKIS